MISYGYFIHLTPFALSREPYLDLSLLYSYILIGAKSLGGCPRMAIFPNLCFRLKL